MYWWDEQFVTPGPNWNSTVLSAYAIDQVPAPSVECATGKPLYPVTTPVAGSNVVVMSSQPSKRLPAPAAANASLSAMYPNGLPGGGGIGVAWLQDLPPSVDLATPTRRLKLAKSKTRFE